jgi:nicotinate-nucleotide pyrophosphorylase (carboxylating)
MPMSDAERAAAEELIELAFREDWGDQGDLTCNAVIPPELRGEAVFASRGPGVLAGLAVAKLIYCHQKSGGSEIEFEPLAQDGAVLAPNDPLARVRGSMAVILSTERVVLNFMQRLSGVATLTRAYAALIEDLPCRLLDTRKTTPGWRLLEKYAVRCGGGHNHRLGLHDGVMLKDNHLAALARAGGTGTITGAVRVVRQKYGTRYPVEVEVDTLDQLDEALTAGPDVVLLDNMPPDLLREAVRRRNQSAPGVKLEASGGVTLSTLRGIAETGVDCVSVGAMTHSAPALDIGLDYLS